MRETTYASCEVATATANAITTSSDRSHKSIYSY